MAVGFAWGAAFGALADDAENLLRSFPATGAGRRISQRLEHLFGRAALRRRLAAQQRTGVQLFRGVMMFPLYL